MSGFNCRRTMRIAVVLPMLLAGGAFTFTSAVGVNSASAASRLIAAVRSEESSHVQSAPSWNTAVEAPGTASLNIGNDASVDQISCPKVGDCGAVGTYSPATDQTALFVVSETNGTWGTATEVPGFAALNTGDGQYVTISISCPSVGDCGVGGAYTSTSSNYLFPYTVAESNGTWGSATQLASFPVTGGDASGAITAIDCTAPGDCTGGGLYGDGTGVEAFVVSHSNGTWGSPLDVPGLSTLNAGNSAFVTAVSCFSTGNCGETGVFTDSSSNSQAFVVNEQSGSWGNAIEIPGLAALNTSGAATPEAISCGAATSCVVGGAYGIAANENQAFVAGESNGTWGSAVELAGTASLDVDNVGVVNDVSCTAATTCVAGGSYEDAQAHSQAFLADETNGTWDDALEVPGTAALNSGGNGGLYTTSCASTGNCAAAGAYRDSAGNVQAFVVNESSGTWGGAIEVPGTPAINGGGFAEVISISCAPDGSCGLGGVYTDASNNSQAFVDSSAATLSAPSAPSIRVTSPSAGSATVTLLRPVNNGGDPVTVYEYSLNGAAWIKVGTAASKTFVVHHLAADKVYRLRLRAENALGVGAPSASESVTVK
jgi:hypothetical protein